MFCIANFHQNALSPVKLKQTLSTKEKSDNFWGVFGTPSGLVLFKNSIDSARSASSSFYLTNITYEKALNFDL